MKPLVSIAVGIGTIAAFGGALAAQRTFVASYGQDINACSLAQPCRSFGVAIGKTDTEGEVIVLDSAGYGSVTVTRSVSIVAPAGIYAGISVGSGANGVTINAASINVRIRGLTINGTTPSSLHGVEVVQGASVVVEDCTIANLGHYALSSNVAADVTMSNITARGNALGGLHLSLGSLTVVDSRIVNNGSLGVLVEAGEATVVRTLVTGNGGGGISVTSSSSPTSIAVGDSTIGGNGAAGLVIRSQAAAAPAYADVMRNTVANNATAGIQFTNGSGGVVKGNASRNQIVGHAAEGIVTSGVPVQARVSDNSVFGNGTGISQGASGALLFTPGDNYVRDNGTDVDGSSADTFL